MKKPYLIVLMFIVIGFISLESCGPVVFTSRLGTPPPPWFYPNRVETVRYVYFPEFTIYYDLYSRNYRYIENNIWITVNTLPARFNNTNFRRSKQVRINNYFDDDINRFHKENRRNSTSKRNR